MKTTKKLNEGIRVAKEGIEECWDDMGGQQMTTGENGEQMSVTISMPGKNISVTTDSAEEIGNILRLAGINIGGGTAGDVDGDGDHDIADHAAELSLPGTTGAGGDEPVIYVGAGEGGGGEAEEYGDQPSSSPLTTNAGNAEDAYADGEKSPSDDAEEEEIKDDSKKETDEATQTPKPWTDMSGKEHPGTAVKGDRYGNQEEKDDEKEKEVDEGKEEYIKERRRMMELAGIEVTDEMLEEDWKSKLAAAGTAAAIGATSLGMMGGLPGQDSADSSVTRPTEYSQQVQAGQQVHAKAEALAKVNKQFAKEYQDGYLKIQDDPRLKDYPKLANQEAVKFTQQLLAKYQANEGVEFDESVEELDEESARILALAGITNEAQSAAQKAAFAKMIAAKKGNKSDDKAEKKDDNKKPDADGDGIPDWADKDKEVKEEAPAGNSIYGQSVYEAESEAARILALAGVAEGRLMNSPADTSMPEPKTYDSLPSKVGVGAGHKDYGQNRANNQGENPMGIHTPDIDSIEEAFTTAMGEYRKFVAENISRKK